MTYRLEPVEGPLAWTRSDFQSLDDFSLSLRAEDHAEVRAAVGWAMSSDLDREALSADDFPLPELATRLRTAAFDQLEGGRGFALVRGIPVDDYDPDELAMLFFGIAAHMGYPEPQDQRGNLLHHVRADKKADFAGNPNLRAFETNVEANFHSDGSDALMFLFRRSAKSGGRSRVISGVSVFNKIVTDYPDLAKTLQEPFYFDTRGQHPDGRRVQVLPIFKWFEERLYVMYKRGYIQFAQRLDDVPRLTAQQIEAMDCLDEVLTNRDNFLDFQLEPGDLELANNYAVLHARDAFEDYDEPDLKRHCLRIWLTLAKDRRPIPPEFAATREFIWSARRRVSLGDSHANL